MTERINPRHSHRSSRQRFGTFVDDYQRGRLEDPGRSKDGEKPGQESARPNREREDQRSRRGYLREYRRSLWPHRYSVFAIFLLAIVVAGLQMSEPLFMRFIVDGILLKPSGDAATRLTWLHLAGGTFFGVIVVSNVINLAKDYRQRLLNTRVMLSLRRALYERLINLPLASLSEMKTGGILSRLTGDVDTTTGLLQMAIVSPSVSLIRLLIAVAVLVTLNWRLALAAMAVIPGSMLISFGFLRRTRPIYRVIRKDVEEIDGRVGERVGSNH